MRANDLTGFTATESEPLEEEKDSTELVSEAGLNLRLETDWGLLACAYDDVEGMLVEGSIKGTSTTGEGRGGSKGKQSN